MKKTKKIFYTEAAYVLGIILLALATALTQAADFGLSPLAAPSYILHLKLSEYLSFFTFGRTEILLEIILLFLTSIITRRFKKKFLFSFVTAAFYGVVLDCWVIILRLIPAEHIVTRGFLFGLGLLICSAAVALFFRTYLPPTAYEIVVKEISDKFKLDTGKFKTVFDCLCLAVSVAASLLFFGAINGMGIGTVVSALANGFFIGKFSEFYDEMFEFKNRFQLDKYFT